MWLLSSDWITVVPLSDSCTPVSGGCAVHIFRPTLLNAGVYFSFPSLRTCTAQLPEHRVAGSDNVSSQLLRRVACRCKQYHRHQYALRVRIKRGRNKKTHIASEWQCSMGCCRTPRIVNRRYARPPASQQHIQLGGPVCALSHWLDDVSNPWHLNWSCTESILRFAKKMTDFPLFITKATCANQER